MYDVGDEVGVAQGECHGANVVICVGQGAVLADGGGYHLLVELQ